MSPSTPPVGNSVIESGSPIAGPGNKGDVGHDKAKVLSPQEISALLPGAILRLPFARPAGRRVLVGRQEFWFANLRTGAWQKSPLDMQHVRALRDGGYGAIELESDGHDEWLSEAQSAVIAELSTPASTVVVLMPDRFPVVILDGVSRAPVWVNEKGEWGLAFTPRQSAALSNKRWSLLSPLQAISQASVEPVDERRLAEIRARIESAPSLDSFASDNAEYYRWYVPGGVRRVEPLTTEQLKDYLVEHQMYAPYEAELAVKLESHAVSEEDMRYLARCQSQTSVAATSTPTAGSMRSDVELNVTM